MLTLRHSFALLLLLASGGCSAGEAVSTTARDSSPQQGWQLLGELDFKLLPEASGMTSAYLNDDRLWLINDQGNPAALIALDRTTMTHRSLEVRGASNRDWEELAAFELDGQPWLMIADVGDNRAVRDHVRLYFVREPGSWPTSGAVEAIGVNMIYPDGARDVEAVAVDPRRDAIYLLSKRTRPPLLYQLPLREAMQQAAASTNPTLRATRLGAVLTIPPPTPLELKLFPKYGASRNQPTAMDLSRDGRRIALLTYGEAYLIPIGEQQSWLDALNQPLQRLAMPILAQPETIAFDSDDNIYLTTERRAAPLLRLPAAARNQP